MDLQTVSALALARDRLAHAAADVDDIRTRARALAATTQWQARAAETYRAALGEWAERLDALAVGIALCDGDLARAQVRAAEDPALSAGGPMRR